MKFKPLNDRLLVQRVQRESKTAGGIIIPDTVTEKPSEGIVVAAGPGKRNDNGTRTELQVKSGDRILFGKYAGTEVKLSGEEYLIMREDDVLAVVEGE